jgi:hypothetical protein
VLQKVHGSIEARAAEIPTEAVSGEPVEKSLEVPSGEADRPSHLIDAQSGI